MTNLISKAFEEHNIRIITDQHGEPWFVAADIAKVLEYRMASDMTRWIDEDERATQIVRTPSGDQEMTVINESGLYSAILRSRKPEAKLLKAKEHEFRSFLCAKRYMYQLSGSRVNGASTRPRKS